MNTALNQRYQRSCHIELLCNSGLIDSGFFKKTSDFGYLCIAQFALVVLFAKTFLTNATAVSMKVIFGCRNPLQVFNTVIGRNSILMIYLKLVLGVRNESLTNKAVDKLIVVSPESNDQVSIPSFFRNKKFGKSGVVVTHRHNISQCAYLVSGKFGNNLPSFLWSH